MPEYLHPGVYVEEIPVAKEQLDVHPETLARLAEARDRLLAWSRLRTDMGQATRRMAWAGVTLLFQGPPGTGKSLAARILAEDLGRPLMRVDLARFVSKYTSGRPRRT